MTDAERDKQIERLARMVDRKERTKRRVEQIIADCESLFLVNPAGERVLGLLEEMFCVAPTSASLAKLSGENAKAALAHHEGAKRVVQFLRAAARGALVIREKAA